MIGKSDCLNIVILPSNRIVIPIIHVIEVRRFNFLFSLHMSSTWSGVGYVFYFLSLSLHTLLEILIKLKLLG
jgi:hypothetical protein